MTIKEELAQKKKRRMVILRNEQNSLKEIEKQISNQNIDSLERQIVYLKLKYIDDNSCDDKICGSLNISKEDLADYYIKNLKFFDKYINHIVNSIVHLSKTAYQKLFQSEYFLSLMEHLTFEQKMYYYLTLARKADYDLNLTKETVQRIVPLDSKPEFLKGRTK